MEITGLRERTIINYNDTIRQFVWFVGIEYIDEIDRDNILAFLAKGNVTKTTRQNRLKALRAVFVRWSSQKPMERDFWDDIEIKVDYEAKQGTTEAELHMLFHLMDFNKSTQFRDATAMMLIWETGIRVSTVAGIEKDMVDFERLLIDFPGRIMKNHKPLTLPISEQMAKMMQEVIRLNQDINPESKYLFITERGTNMYKKTIPTS